MRGPIGAHDVGHVHVVLGVEAPRGEDALAPARAALDDADAAARDARIDSPLRPGRRHALLRFVRRVDEARMTSGSIRGSVVAVARGVDDERWLLHGYGAADGAARRAAGREDARDREHQTDGDATFHIQNVR